MPIALQPSGRQRRPSARIAVARASPSSLRIAGTPTKTSAIVPPTQTVAERRWTMRSAVITLAGYRRGSTGDDVSSTGNTPTGFVYSSAAWSFDDWLLALHLLSAFALVGAIIVFWVAIVAIRRTDLPEQVVAAGRLLPVANVVVTVGSLGTIIFGIWLAIALDGDRGVERLGDRGDHPLGDRHGGGPPRRPVTFMPSVDAREGARRCGADRP